MNASVSSVKVPEAGKGAQEEGLGSRRPAALGALAAEVLAQLQEMDAQYPNSRPKVRKRSPKYKLMR